MLVRDLLMDRLLVDDGLRGRGLLGKGLLIVRLRIPRHRVGRWNERRHLVIILLEGPEGILDGNMRIERRAIIGLTEPGRRSKRSKTLVVARQRRLVWV